MAEQSSVEEKGQEQDQLPVEHHHQTQAPTQSEAQVSTEDPTQALSQAPHEALTHIPAQDEAQGAEGEAQPVPIVGNVLEVDVSFRSL